MDTGRVVGRRIKGAAFLAARHFGNSHGFLSLCGSEALAPDEAVCNKPPKKGLMVPPHPSGKDFMQ